MRTVASATWVTEGVTFEPGNTLPVFETRFGPIGVIICYDFWFNPELTRLLALPAPAVAVAAPVERVEDQHHDLASVLVELAADPLQELVKVHGVTVGENHKG